VSRCNRLAQPRAAGHGATTQGDSVKQRGAADRPAAPRARRARPRSCRAARPRCGCAARGARGAARCASGSTPCRRAAARTVACPARRACSAARRSARCCPPRSWRRRACAEAGGLVRSCLGSGGCALRPLVSAEVAGRLPKSPKRHVLAGVAQARVCGRQRRGWNEPAPQSGHRGCCCRRLIACPGPRERGDRQCVRSRLLGAI